MKERILVTGGAGFVGTNLADRLAESGCPVTVFDNLSRAGVERNLDWLVSKHGSMVRPIIGDIRDRAALQPAMADARAIYHLAAQVAVTTSLDDPFADFEVNALGTLNVLEACRKSDLKPPVIFTSTNKVYGGLNDVPLVLNGTRYHPREDRLKATGIGEWRPLDFHSPYGCSKGCADQYVVDYARTMGIRSVVFRMSCIYGPHQFGTEDQGWVAHFLIRAMQRRPITLFGDGKQVRDILFVEDLVDAFLLALERINCLSGSAFNIGGGPRNSISLVELLKRIHAMTGIEPCLEVEPWRVGDQRYYVSDVSKFRGCTGWTPRVSIEEGLERLHRWLLAEGSDIAASARPAGVELF